jgi:hypothetical protein
MTLLSADIGFQPPQPSARLARTPAAVLVSDDVRDLGSGRPDAVVLPRLEPRSPRPAVADHGPRAWGPEGHTPGGRPRTPQGGPPPPSASHGLPSCGLRRGQSCHHAKKTSNINHRAQRSCCVLCSITLVLHLHDHPLNALKLHGIFLSHRQAAAHVRQSVRNLCRYLCSLKMGPPFEALHTSIGAHDGVSRDGFLFPRHPGFSAPPAESFRPPTPARIRGIPADLPALARPVKSPPGGSLLPFPDPTSFPSAASQMGR